MEVQARPSANKYDALLYQIVDLDVASGGSYALCIQGGSSSVAGNVLRFALDGGAALHYVVPGGGPRAELELPSTGVGAGCFRFNLGASGTPYSGRISIEFGDTSGELALCEATLRRCTARRIPRNRPALDFLPPSSIHAAPACPADLSKLDSFYCNSADLSDELLGSPGFTGADAQGDWTTHAWEAGAASFTFGPRGAFVDVLKQSQNKTYYDVTMNQEVSLETSVGDSYELCVQGGAVEDGAQIRFAVDSGMPLFTVPGMQERTVLEMKAGELSSTCFRFALDPSVPTFTGRVALELGKNLGEVSLCQVSLRRCRQHSYIEGAMPAVRRCYVAPLEEEASGGCSKLATYSGEEFGVNAYGQETGGKLTCLERLRASSGNSFVFSEGQCELWSCPSRADLLISASGDRNSEVYSELCEYQEPVAGKRGQKPRTPIIVKLWEWNFEDIAHECEEYLGPNGIDAVQVAPVTEHMINSTWFAKYQPVSFKLSSRSGTAEEFKCMVATCRAAGVEVLVDVVLNHLARPCDAVRHVGADAVTPCYGWAGSRYGNRRTAETPGWPARGPEDFHHLSSDRLVNCAVDPKTFQCPESTPPNDCTQCDFLGIPDWNTGLPTVQEMLGKHLKELFNIGVSMIRLDAASYIKEKELSLVVNQVPWDYIFQEWWSGMPSLGRSRYVGAYRDIFYGRKINQGLVQNAATDLPKLLNLTHGLDGLSPEQVIYPLAMHDSRTFDYDPAVPTYKGGLEFHLQQKFLLAHPAGHIVRLWGGYGWTDLDEGPPGCQQPNERCTPEPVFDAAGQNRCMPTPLTTPLDEDLAKSHRWVCEHRWAGIAGLIGFRKACRGLPITQKWEGDVEKGSLAFTAGDACFVALQREMTPLSEKLGDWPIVGLKTGLPEGRYCDVASLPTKKGWDGKSCPREVLLGPLGVVQSGSVLEGDLVAIHIGALLPDDAASEALEQLPRSKTIAEQRVCAPSHHISAAVALRGRSAPLGTALALVMMSSPLRSF